VAMRCTTGAALFLMVFYPVLSVHPQEPSPQNQSFLQTVSGERIYGTVEYFHSVTKGHTLLLNHSKTVYPMIGMAFQNENGYFVFVETKAWKTIYAAKRIRSGKLDLFAIDGHEKADFFSKGGGEVLAIDRKNLFNKLSDNSTSAGFLKTYQSMNVLSKILLIGGGSSVLYGLSKSDHAAMFIGVCIISSGALTRYWNRTYLYKAIDCY
jgi:hypothetical protein